MPREKILRRRDDEDFRLKRNWAVHKCYWMARDKDTAMMPGKVVERALREEIKNADKI